jgi:hypothetical protein
MHRYAIVELLVLAFSLSVITARAATDDAKMQTPEQVACVRMN